MTLCCRISMAEKTYKDAFNDELESFKARVRARAQARIEEATKQVEEVRRECGRVLRPGLRRPPNKWRR